MMSRFMPELLTMSIGLFCRRLLMPFIAGPKTDNYLFLLKSVVYLKLVNASQMFLFLLTVQFCLLSTLAVTWALLSHRICHRHLMLTVLLQTLMRVLMQYIDGTPIFWCGRI